MFYCTIAQSPSKWAAFILSGLLYSLYEQSIICSCFSLVFVCVCVELEELSTTECEMEDYMEDNLSTT